MGPDTPEFFLTARNSVGTFRIAWSFYAAAMGSWTLFSPASYANTAGDELSSIWLKFLPVLAVVLVQHAQQRGTLLMTSFRGIPLHIKSS